MSNDNEIQKFDSGLACFMLVIQFLNVKISKEQMEHEMAISNKMDEVNILYFSKKLKLKAKYYNNFKLENLNNIKQPIIGKRNNGDFFLIIRKQEDKILILYPDKMSPELIVVDDLAQMWSGATIIIGNKGILDKEAVFGFKWFIPTILKFKNELIQVLVAAFVIQLLGILGPLMTQAVVDKVLGHNSLSTLYILTIGLFIGYIFELILSLAKNYVFTHTTNRIDVILSYRLFKHLFALPLRYFESRRVGETIARVRELENIRSFLTGTPLSSLLDLLFIVVYIAVLFFYSVPLTFVVIGSIPVFAIVSLTVTPMFKKRLDEKFRTGSESQSFLIETVTGVQTVKSFAIEPKLLNKWGDLQSDYVKACYKTSMVAATANTASQFIQKTFDLLILFLAAKAVLNGNFTVGQLVAFRMLAGRVSSPVLRFVQLWQEYQQASLSVKRIGDIFNSIPEPVSDMNNMTLPQIEGRIKFENVRFRYRVDASEVIRDMCFNIDAGKIIGIVGRSGSGKSTISKLIQRLYIPEGGKILIDGMDISLTDSAWLRNQIGVVLQENYMFNGTVAENISIHFPGATNNQIINAAKIAGAHEFIMELQNGYDTIIGEKGVGLSGGQKQRVAIARAIIKNPRILIFDEATSALDYESESIIQNNLKQICKNRTVIIIAHRLSTLKEAEKIMVVDRGSLIEYDTHDNLMVANGLYAYLYKKQSRGDI